MKIHVAGNTNGLRARDPETGESLLGRRAADGRVVGGVTYANRVFDALGVVPQRVEQIGTSRTGLSWEGSVELTHRQLAAIRAADEVIRRLDPTAGWEEVAEAAVAAALAA